MIHLNKVILGGGPAGIGAANALHQSADLFEKEDHLGGLCSSFLINGFRFDHSVHLSFTSNPIVLDYFSNIPIFHHSPDAQNYADGFWIKHPVQNNLFPLPKSEKEKIIAGFKERAENKDPKNYEEWLFASYGRYFSQRYPCRYTKKYWCHTAKELSTNWCGGRIYLPSIEEVVYGSSHESTPNVYYAKDMRYPQKGGFQTFFSSVSSRTSIHLNSEVVFIDPEKRSFVLKNGMEYSYSSLFFSLPLNMVYVFFKNAPSLVKKASKSLECTSMANVSVAFKRLVSFPSLWFYIYDEDIPFSRAYSPSLKSPENAPFGKSSLQFEYYYLGKTCPLSEESLIGSAASFLQKAGIAEPSEIDFINVTYQERANAVFLLNMEKNRAIVLDYLRSFGIIPIGRFGLWDYLWSDQSYYSGFQSAIGTN